MRDYGKVSPRFWVGDTGRKLRKLRATVPDAQLIALFLMTGPTSVATGLYHLPLEMLTLYTGSPSKGALKALRSLQDEGFSFYDQDVEHVWVPNMAKEQLGGTIKPSDNRHGWLLRELQPYRKSPFFPRFVEKYRGRYHLPEDFCGSPFEGASKDLRRGHGADPTPPSKQGEGEGEIKGEGEGEGYTPLNPPGGFPAALDTAAFRSAWAEWVQHRKEIRKALTERAVKKQLTDLAIAGEAAAVEAIHTAIRNGWQGVFPKPEQGNGTKPGRIQHRFYDDQVYPGSPEAGHGGSAENG